MAIEQVDKNSQLAIGPNADQDLRVAPNRRLQQRQRAVAHLPGLDLGDFILPGCHSELGCLLGLYNDNKTHVHSLRGFWRSALVSGVSNPASHY
jgi:hypothetical protein